MICYLVLPTTFHVFLKSSVSMTRYPSTTPGFWALNLTMKLVSSFCRRDPSFGSTVNSGGVSAVKAARKSAKPMNGFFSRKENSVSTYISESTKIKEHPLKSHSLGGKIHVWQRDHSWILPSQWCLQGLMLELQYRRFRPSQIPGKQKNGR